MSAYVVNKAHIDAMVRLAIRHKMDYYNAGNEPRPDPRGQPNALGQMLLDACVKSVAHRYPKDKLTDLPGPTGAYWVLPYRYSPMGRVPTPVQGLKLVGCFDYQSCEHPDWEKSAAYGFCQALKATLIGALPGYDEAPWEWPD